MPKRTILLAAVKTGNITGLILYSLPSCAEDFTITLKQGKNLISIPLIPQDTSVSQALQSINGLYTDVWGFDLTDPVDPWKHYHPAYISYSDLTTVEHGRGYYVFVNQDCALTVTGSRIEQNYILTLNEGWNVIGWPYLYSDYIYEVISDLQFGIHYNQVSRINPETKEQEDYYNDPQTDIFDTFDPGIGYYIYCLQPVTVTILLIPQIEITSHQDNSYVTTPSIEISGIIDNDNTTVTVNGIPAIVTSGMFTAYNIPLTEGQNTIIADATNTAGNSSYDLITLNLDSQAPLIQITDPQDGAVINTAPITVSGTIDEPCDVLVNSVLAAIDGTTFTAEDVDLQLGENTITATAYDIAGNTSADTITVTSTTTSDYVITKLTPDVYEYDPTDITAGSQVPLTIRLKIDGSPAENESIEFLVTQGNGSMVQFIVNTDINGEATGLLNTDTDASVTNLVEVFDQNFPDEKVTFHIDTKEGPPAQLVKLTDETQTPAPGAAIPIIVKLTDVNSNLIENEVVNFSISQGGGTLSAGSAITNYYGIATVSFTTPLTPETLTQIVVSSVTVPSVATTFSITTSAESAATIEDIITAVNTNDERIQDIKADIIVTSNAPFLPPEMHLKIWQKGNLQKVEETYPEQKVKIRPQLETSAEYIETEREILSYDPSNNIYAIKTKEVDQVEEYPYRIDHVDYTKGVAIKTEYYSKEGDEISRYTIEDSDFIQINDTWVFQRQTKTLYRNLTEPSYTITSVYSNIQINTGIPDEEFE